MDMRGEWSDSTDESPSSKRVIEHHRGSEFEPSELSQKMQAVDNRIAELEKQKQEMRSELEKKGRAPQTAMEKKLEAMDLFLRVIRETLFILSLLIFSM